MNDDDFYEEVAPGRRRHDPGTLEGKKFWRARKEFAYAIRQVCDEFELNVDETRQFESAVFELMGDIGLDLTWVDHASFVERDMFHSDGD